MTLSRNRLGKGATGPITYLAQAKGYKSVKDFLEGLKAERKAAPKQEIKNFIVDDE